jgi:hypothetical protein
MSRFFTTARCLGVLVFFAIGLVGCDQTPSSVEEFEVQGTMNSPSSLVVTPDLQPEFEVEYQGLQEPPTIDTPSRIGVESLGEAKGSPRDGGSKRWRLTLGVDNIDELLVQDAVLIRGTEINGGEVVDTLSATATTSLSVQTNFSSSFLNVADFEGDVGTESYVPTTDSGVEEPAFEGNARTISTSGGTEVNVINPDPDGFGTPDATNQPEGSNGVRFLEVEGTSSGSVTIERRTSLPGLDFMTFMVRQASATFSLTITLVEETGSGATRRELELPIPAGSEWLKMGIPFGFFGDEFNPVASRSGGNGPLTSIEFSADGDVTYAIDEILFGTEEVGPRVEFHDFERSNLAYGPPFCTGNSYAFADSVAAASDGYTSHSVSGTDCFGFNYGDGFAEVALGFVDVDGNDVLSFRAQGASDTTEVEAFIESFEGGFNGDQAVTVNPPNGAWEQFEIPLNELGSDPSALKGNLHNVGFNAVGEFLIDDIKIMPKN